MAGSNKSSWEEFARRGGYQHTPIHRDIDYGIAGDLSGKANVPWPRDPAIEPAPDFSGRGPRGYQRSDDKILQDVVHVLTMHPWVDASEIEVKVRDGVICLQGIVQDRDQKHLAEEATSKISGVREVHNYLIVHPSFFTQMEEHFGLP
jgi:hypothetical protein